MTLFYRGKLTKIQIACILLVLLISITPVSGIWRDFHNWSSIAEQHAGEQAADLQLAGLEVTEIQWHQEAKEWIFSTIDIEGDEELYVHSYGEDDNEDGSAGWILSPDGNLWVKEIIIYGVVITYIVLAAIVIWIILGGGGSGGGSGCGGWSRIVGSPVLFC